MTDAHCHAGAPARDMRFVCAARMEDWDGIARAESAGDLAFFGIHPFFAGDTDPEAVADALRGILAAHPRAGVGEIGLDRLRDRSAVPAQIPLFEAQLRVAAEMHRPVVIHGAKAWGRAFETVKPFTDRIPAVLFHGFSRAGGLVDGIVRCGGWFGVGPAILNRHAVNYRELVRSLPRERILAETDSDGDPEIPPIENVVAGIADVFGKPAGETGALLEENARRFTALCGGGLREPDASARAGRTEGGGK